MVVTSSGQSHLQLGNRRSIAVSVSWVAVVAIIVPVRRMIPIRIIAVAKRVRNAPGPTGVPTPVVRITKSADKDERATGESIMPRIAAPIAAAPVSTPRVAGFYRFASAGFRL